MHKFKKKWFVFTKRTSTKQDTYFYVTYSGYNNNVPQQFWMITYLKPKLIFFIGLTEEIFFVYLNEIITHLLLKQSTTWHLWITIASIW